MTRNQLFGVDPKNPLGLVLSGGGARGVFQVGVWEVLSQDPKGLESHPDVISGTSAGALNGAFIAAGLSAHDMLNFWLSLADNPPVIANETFFQSLLQAIQKLAIREPIRPLKKRKREARTLMRLFRKHSWYKPSGIYAMVMEFLLTARFDSVSQLLESIKTSYLFNTEPVRERLRKTIGGPFLRQTRIKLAINTVDVRTGDVVRLVNHRPLKAGSAVSLKQYRYEPTISLDMLIASASIPLLFNPVRVGNHVLWDGGLLVNTPLAPSVALGATRIIPVLVTLRDHKKDQNLLQSMGSAIERLADAFLENAYNIDRKLLLERNTLAQLVPELNLTDVELYRAIRPAPDYIFDAGSYLFFERNAMLEMYEAGKRAARRWLAGGPTLDERDQEY